MTATENSFRKSERLRSAREFRSVLRKGSSLRGGGIALYYSKRSLSGGSRLGIIVGRRVFRSAVKRNRAKRIVREFFRLRKYNFQPGFDIVVKFMDSINSLETHNLGQVLIRLFERAGVFGASV